jgi:hypothetical protein
MTALNPSATAAAAPNLDIEAADHRSDNRQSLLILRGDTSAGQVAATVGADVGERRPIGLIGRTRSRAPPASAIRGSRAASGTTAVPLRVRLRKRRGLPKAGASRGIELFFEPVVLSLQPITVPLDLAPLPLRSRQLLTQSRDLLLLTINQLIAVPLARHATVMPDSSQSYKHNFFGPHVGVEVGFDED